MEFGAFWGVNMPFGGEKMMELDDTVLENVSAVVDGIFCYFRAEEKYRRRCSVYLLIIRRL